MRYAELLFLALLVVYQAILLVPRHRRLFAANYLVFLAGMALAWNLALEGLRWQTLPGIALLLLDVAILFPTVSRLRGRLRQPGWWPATLAFFRSVVALVGFLVALATALLAVAFPLPQVTLTGGLTPSYRIVRFPPTGEGPGVELRLWYPASGDTRVQPRAISEPESWQRIRAEGGLPVFWNSYWEHLPSSSIRGGRLAAPKTKYPVIYVVVPTGQNPGDFGYLFEDLASRGFVVVAGVPIPQALPPPPAFEWGAAWTELLRPVREPHLWLEPEATLNKGAPLSSSDQTLFLCRDALRQLAAEPGDPFYAGLDWSRQGLWVWGPGNGPAPERLETLGIRGILRAGAPVGLQEHSMVELWISPEPSSTLTSGRWVLTVPHLVRADLSDAAYLKPYLAFFGLKSQADAGFHGAIRQYQAAFFQYVFWNTGTGASFGQTVPEVPGLVLSGR